MIDVSDNQGPIDWHMVRESGVERAYIKLGEGLTEVDTQALANIHHARAATVQIGLYYFAHPSGDPESAASRFLELAHGHLLAGDLVPALDLEVTEGRSLPQLAAWKAAWFAVVDAAVGAESCFYSYRSMLNYMYPHLKPERPVWGAAPGGVLTAFEAGRWAFHQYTFQGRCPGIAGHVDEDLLVAAAPPVIPPAV